MVLRTYEKQTNKTKEKNNKNTTRTSPRKKQNIIANAQHVDPNLIKSEN